MSYPHVEYWRLNKGDKKVKRCTGACFSGLNYNSGTKMPEAIRFVAKLPDKLLDGNPLKVEELDFFIRFTKQMLTRPECPKFYIRKLKDNKLLYNVKTKGMKYVEALLYLTWFRIPQEHCEIVPELFKRHKEGDTLETTFDNFQKIHDEIVAGQLKILKWNTLCGHGLIYKYAGYGVTGPAKTITIENFVKNIKDKVHSVNAHFL